MKIWIIIILLCSANAMAVYGNRIWPLHYTNESSRDVPYSIIVGYICSNSGCQTIDGTLWNQPKISNQFGRLTIEIPITGKYYLFREFGPGYRSKKVDPFIYTSGTYNEKTIVFEKTKQCKSTFTTTIQSCAEQGLPLTILTDTKLDATTKSAYIPSNDYYFPKNDPQFRPYRELKTRMTVNVKNKDTNAVQTGFPSQQEFNIYADETHDFSFLWETTKNTAVGTYTITMTSTVPDAKCDQSTMVPYTITQDVYIAASFDTCVANVNNFAVSGRTVENAYDKDAPMTFSGTQLHAFQDWTTTGTNCQTKGSLVGGESFGVSYTLKRDGTTVKTGTIPASGDYQNEKPFLFHGHLMHAELSP